MNSYFSNLTSLLLNLIFVLIWISGAVILTREFFTDFREKKYDGISGETEKFKEWKAGRYTRIKKGVILLFTGIALQLILKLFFT